MLVERKQTIQYEHRPTPAKTSTHPKKNSVRAKFLITVFVCALMAMMVTVRSESIISKGYELAQLKAKAMLLEKENEQLRLQIARLKSPQRIQQIAANEMGMTVPQQIYCAVTPELTGKAPAHVIAEKISQPIFELKKAEAGKVR